MKIISFARKGHCMIPCEVELCLTSGIPKVEIIGLADPSIRECISRIKTAFHAQNFKWPNKKQITINLRPAYIKKTSQGLDLAIACALLWKTQQIDPPVSMSEEQFIYGEVTLDGQVEAPPDWIQIDQHPLLTGKIKDQEFFNDLYIVENLKELSNPQFVQSKPFSHWMKRPDLPSTQFSQNSAFLLEVVSSGEHSVFLGGEAGSGKTTLASHIPYLLEAPDEEDFKTSKKMAKYSGRSLNWRPFIAPHHSTPPLSMIGGGSSLFMGEISKAHSGVLFLDEYLEFQYKVQEALREPIETGEICISRQGKGVFFPARFMLVAAANLCPCGSYVPGENFSCSYSLRKCRSCLDRLSGPMLDRFDILALSSFWKGPLKVSLESMRQRIERASDIRQKRHQEKVNGRLSWDELNHHISPFILKNLLPSEVSSYRRKTAILRVARTLADLEGRKEVIPQDIEKSTLLTLKSFHQLKFC